MRKFFALLLVLSAGSIRETFRPSYEILVDDTGYEIGGAEDLMGRLEYELLQTADPKTGQIPFGIRSAELAYAEKISTFSNRARTQSLDEIEPAGPFNVGGRTRAIAFDVRNEQIILAGGVSGGIWKSTDGGSTWIRKSDPTNRNSVTCIVQDTRPGMEDVWYHGTGELAGNSASLGTGTNRAVFRGDGIYKSLDNGETWNPIPSTQDASPNNFNSQFQYIWDIEINEQNLVEDEILVAAYGGILRSADGGDTWEVELGQQLFDLPDSVDLNEVNASFYTSLSQSDNGVFYAALSTVSTVDQDSEDAGIYISVDGREWTEDISPFTAQSQYRRIVFGHSHSDPTISYMLVDANPVFILEFAVLRFNETDTAFDFDVRVTPNFESELGFFDTQGSYNMMIRVHPEDERIVYAGGTNLYRSTDGFRTSENTKWIGGYEPGEGTSIYPNHHPDQHDLLFYPSNPDRLLSANDGGIRLSNDGVADSVMWQSLNNGFITSQFFTIAQSKSANNPSMIGGMQDNGTDLVAAAGNTNWQGVIGGDGGYAATTRNDFLWFASFQRGQTLRLTLDKNFDLTSFGRVDPGGLVEAAGSSYLFINPFVLDPTNENRMFVAGGNNLYFNPNVSQIPGGTQEPTALGWQSVTSELDIPEGVVTALDISIDAETLYFGTSQGQLFKLNDADRSIDFRLEEISNAAFPENGYVHVSPLTQKTTTISLWYFLIITSHRFLKVRMAV